MQTRMNRIDRSNTGKMVFVSIICIIDIILEIKYIYNFQAYYQVTWDLVIFMVRLLDVKHFLLIAFAEGLVSADRSIEVLRIVSRKFEDYDRLVSWLIHRKPLYVRLVSHVLGTKLIIMLSKILIEINIWLLEFGYIYSTRGFQLRIWHL